jgi:hypothetical protein
MRTESNKVLLENTRSINCEVERRPAQSLDRIEDVTLGRIRCP